MTIDDLNMYAYFWGGFFAPLPLVSVVAIWQSVRRAMWASVAD